MTHTWCRLNHSRPETGEKFPGEWEKYPIDQRQVDLMIWRFPHFEWEVETRPTKNRRQPPRGDRRDFSGIRGIDDTEMIERILRETAY